jgi:hypothetical protein
MKLPFIHPLVHMVGIHPSIGAPGVHQLVQMCTGRWSIIHGLVHWVSIHCCNGPGEVSSIDAVDGKVSIHWCNARMGPILPMGYSYHP